MIVVEKGDVAYPSTSHTPTDTGKGEKGGKEVEISVLKNCPLCPRSDNGRLHYPRLGNNHENEKDCHAGCNLSIELREIYRNS